MDSHIYLFQILDILELVGVEAMRLTQKMSVLAKFTAGSRCNTEEIECLNEIKAGITKILNFEAHTFIGYNSLWEFSNTPGIKEYLRSIVAGTSHRYKARAGKIEFNVSNSSEMNTYHEIQRRLGKGHLPYVSISGMLTGNHAVIVYGESVIDNKNVLCVRDPNFIGSEAEACENYLYADSEDQIYFKRTNQEHDLMQTFMLTGDEELRVSKYKKALSRQCMSEANQ